MTLQQLRYTIAIAESGSMNVAARDLYVSQPSLSESVKELEEELGFAVFNRTNRGITVTSEGEEFLGYARQTIEQFHLLEDRFLETATRKKHFHVSTQHYSFAVNAFANLMNQDNMAKYDFALSETRTYEIIENVRDFRSDIGILYQDEENAKMLSKVIKENHLVFNPLFDCHIFIYVAATHPLAGKKKVTFEDLEEYTCMMFDQGKNNAFYLAEEVFSTMEHEKVLKVNDRATMLNMMVAIDGYTMCSGIICEELNGDGYAAVPLDTDRIMTIGYVVRKDAPNNALRDAYIEELKKWEKKVL